MRQRFLYALLLCILITTGCSDKVNSVARLNKLSTLQPQTQAAINELRIINSQTSIRRGGVGFITLQGDPGVRYIITTSYNLRGRTIDVSQWRVAGTSGQFTFNWVVDPETAPGTYLAVISGGGRTLSINHTVLP